jgi:hypothetical protein
MRSDRFFREIRIDGLPAKGVEVVEAADETLDSGGVQWFS